MTIIVVVLAFAGTTLGVIGLLALVLPTPNLFLARLHQVLTPGPNGGRTALTSTGRQSRVGVRVHNIVEQLGRMMPSKSQMGQSEWGKLLVQAGYRSANAVMIFQGYRALLAVLLPGIFLLIAPYLRALNGMQQSAATLALMAAGLFLPHWWLLARVKGRQEEIAGALPNALDLMVVCVEAGLGLDATFQRLAQEQQFTKQTLSEEFQIVCREVRAGRPRHEALLALKERVGLAEISSLVVVLIQAEKMGTGIARALRVHADSVRTKQRQRAEEQAAKIPVKMVFPLVLFLFPATLMVLLGPSYLIIFKAMAAMKR